MTNTDAGDGTRDTTDDTDDGRATMPFPGQSESEADDWDPPSKLRKPLFRDRIRDRLGLGPRQWYILESLLLVAPYPLFVFIYLTFDVNETAFLVATLIYSVIAVYVGFIS